jgi:hypothetical protein
MIGCTVSAYRVMDFEGCRSFVHCTLSSTPGAFLLPGRAKEKEFSTQIGAMLPKFDDMMFQCIKLY